MKKVKQNTLMKNYILEEPLVFTGCRSIQFFSLPCFPSTASKAP